MRPTLWLALLCSCTGVAILCCNWLLVSRAVGMHLRDEGVAQLGRTPAPKGFAACQQQDRGFDGNPCVTCMTCAA